MVKSCLVVNMQLVTRDSAKAGDHADQLLVKLDLVSLGQVIDDFEKL